MRVLDRLIRTSVAVLLTLFTLPLTAAAAAPAPKYDSLYVFGDSLADNGNVFLTSKALSLDPAPPPSVSPHRTYFNGRFSNGPVGVEYLWQLLSGQAPGSPKGLKPFLAAPILGATGAVNFAFGGTGTPYLDQTPGGLWAPGLKGQIELFRAALRGRKPSKRALYVISTAANDYRLDAFNQPMPPPDVVQNIADAVTTLYRLGARDVMVLNLPDLGLIPANAGAPGPATLLTQVHNSLLAAAMTSLAARLPNLNLIQIDLLQVYALLTGMNQTVPALAFLFPPGTLPPGYPPDFPMAACLFIDPATCLDATTAAHQVLGEFLYHSAVQ
jgi:phospholipase/lecithinase/hemolysin